VKDNRQLDAEIVRMDRAKTFRGYPFVTFDEMDLESPAKQWLVKGIFARGETSAWIAPPGAMKSALLAEAAVCIGAGLDWHGFRNKGAMGVVYFALERADLVKRRLRAHKQKLGLSGTPICVSSALIEMTHPESSKRVVDTIRDAETVLGTEIGLVIIDTHAKLIAAGAGDENSAKDQGAIFANLQRIKNATGVHIGLIGHTGKDETRGARGSNALLGDVDVMVMIETNGEVRTARVTKASDIPDGPLFSFKSEVHDFGSDEDGDPISVNIVSADEVATQSGKSGGKWPKGLKLVHDSIIAALLDEGVVHQVAGSGPSVRAVEVRAARSVHSQRYVSTGEGDAKDAERKSWGRNFTEARNRGLISGETISGRELIWLSNG